MHQRHARVCEVITGDNQEKDMALMGLLITIERLNREKGIPLNQLESILTIATTTFSKPSTETLEIHP